MTYAERARIADSMGRIALKRPYRIDDVSRAIKAFKRRHKRFPSSVELQAYMDGKGMPCAKGKAHNVGRSFALRHL